MPFSSRRKQTVRYAIIQSLGYLVGVFVNFPLQYLIPTLLGPAGVGGLRVINLVKKYATYANLGVIKGYRKQYVEALADGDNTSAEQIDQIGFTATLLSAIVSICFVILIYMLDIDVGGAFTRFAAIVICFSLIAERLYSYITVRAQSLDEFDAVGRTIFYIRILTPIYMLIGVVLGGLNGILVALLLVPLTGTYFLRRSLKQLSPGFLLRWQPMRVMFVEGGWQYLDGLFTNLILTMGLALSVFYLSETEIGLYAFAEGIFTATLTLPASLQTIYFNNMVNIRKRYQREEADKSDFRPIFSTPLTMFVVFTLLIMSAKYLAFVFLVEVALPDFQASLPIMSTLLFGQSLYITQTIATQYFVATDQTRMSAILSGMWALITYFILSYLLRHNPDPLTVALGSTITLLGYTGLFLFIVFYQTSNQWIAVLQQLRYWLACFMVCGILVFIAGTPQFVTGMTIFGRIFELLLDFGVLFVTVILVFSTVFVDQKIIAEIYKSVLYLLQIAWKRFPLVHRTHAQGDTPLSTEQKSSLDK